MRRLALLPLLALAACEWAWTSYGPEGSAQEFPVLAKEGAVAPEAPAPLRLKVMTWNVKYGAGRIDFWFDLWGDRVEMSMDEVDFNMGRIYDLINEVQPDVLVTNEIEINSKRSAYFDMVKGVLDHTDLRYAAYVPLWQDRYVASEGVGRVDTGNCIFSRYPIVKNERIAQADRTDQSVIISTFYWHRAVGHAVLQVGTRQVAVYAVHTEAYDMDRTNAKQQKQILELIRAEKLPFVLAGDLNALPPGSVKTSKFNDEAPESIGTDFEQPPYNPEDLRPFYDEFREAIPLASYGTTEQEQSHWYSHSVIGPDTVGANGEPGHWTRRLDYLFVRKADQWLDADVLQTKGRGTGPGTTVTASGQGLAGDPLYLSDHCPVVGIWEVAP
ncbi:MAG TPA: endonuclease/exonuclease/phosphatase family protein [Myxococcales bacterium]|jgi:endonuclease/exonuclease/phosphatase family metal-dependent hydrolase